MAKGFDFLVLSEQQRPWPKPLSSTWKVQSSSAVWCFFDSLSSYSYHVLGTLSCLVSAPSQLQRPSFHSAPFQRPFLIELVPLATTCACLDWEICRVFCNPHRVSLLLCCNQVSISWKFSRSQTQNPRNRPVRKVILEHGPAWLRMCHGI